MDLKEGFYNMAYFVTYQLSNPHGGRTAPKNVILRTTHPVVWAASAPKMSDRYGRDTFILFWCDFPNYYIVEKVKECFEVKR